MEGNHRAGRGRLPEGDIGDGAGAGHDANATLAAAGEGGDTVDDVMAVGDFHDVCSEGIGTVSGDDDGWLGLVFGSRWSSSCPSCDFTTFSVDDNIVIIVGLMIGSVFAGFFTFSFSGEVEATATSALFFFCVLV